jgi:GNAT superfamily N-acetyltransferase
MKEFVSIIQAETEVQYAAMEGLARRIVPAFYGEFFAVETAEYLVESGHTAAALAAQAGRGSRHFLIDCDGEAVGYFSLSVEGTTMLLSHFYVLAAWRGKGLGRGAMAFMEEAAKGWGVQRIELFVLRTNEGAVGMYARSGFVVAEEVLTRLGNGAVLEDFVMRKCIDR